MSFFFQAEDGIRDKLVTGVQTCALPIFQGTVIYCKNKTYFRDDCGNIYEVINGKIMGEKLKLSDD